MKRLLAFLISLAAFASDVSAQLSVQLRMEKDAYLLYEAIPVIVTIRNNSGRNIQLDGSRDFSWLDFTVNDNVGAVVPRLGRVNTEQTVLLPAGQAITRTVDLTPMFEMRAAGNYRVRVALAADMVRAFSETLKFNITKGRDLWQKTVGLPSVDNDKDEYRNYALQAYRSDKDERLFAIVKDDPPRVVYGVVPLGPFLPIYQPVTEIDRYGHLHVLYQNGPRSFAYVEIDPRARQLQRAVYSDHMSFPRLVNQKGAVAVQGGEQIYPRQERILTEAELNPPPPTNAPPKKKKHWWSPEPKESDFGELPSTTPPSRDKR
jgi:hypothetical protein